MGRTYSTHRINGNTWSKINLQERDQHAAQDLDKKRRYRNWGLEKQVFEVWTGLNWLITGSTEQAGYIVVPVNEATCWPAEQVREHQRLSATWILSSMSCYSSGCLQVVSHSLWFLSAPQTAGTKGGSHTFPVCGEEERRRLKFPL